MRIGRPELERGAFYVTFATCVSILFSIAVSQILMGAALVLLIASRAKLRLPPVWLPMVLFMTGTVISLLLSGDVRRGLPQIRKFYVWLILLLVFSTFRKLREVRWMVAGWTAVAVGSAVYSLIQFAQKYQDALDADQDFYQVYVARRITGFMGHWMTFGGEEMVVLFFLAAFLFFAAASRRWKVAGSIAGGVLLVSMVLGFTRGIWLGTLAGGLYLLWFWRRWWIAIVPVVLLAGLAVGPVRERVVSLFQPHGERDSNQFRIVVWRTGLEMIRAHPWFGLGPEQVGPQLEKYVPRDIPRPLPDGYYGHLHNIYIHYAAERGIPTMLAIMWLIGQALWDFASTLWRRPAGDARFVLHAAVAAIIGLLVVGCVEYNLGDSEVLTLFLCTVCFGYLAKETVEAVPPADSSLA
ncbi:MAG: O-antigen ligase family protein [Bryobacteraceae bacterium]|jgi:O-antigen ligase